ncbi:hypothetical protein AC578_10281 [Pseudocercospora eumusae]|uniref:Uncharacterized protein n=1 Tax=Pseudocercospora eumusae TaxID=321146 RepID=A0A139HRL3_9PEZI|nr:hypothetical protein AC578_10281 [Pseudocercospora eumusae]
MRIDDMLRMVQGSQDFAQWRDQIHKTELMDAGARGELPSLDEVFEFDELDELETVAIFKLHSHQELEVADSQSSSAVTAVITCYSTTLESLRLGQIICSKGTERDCFRAFAGRMPQLQEVKIRAEFVGGGETTELWDAADSERLGNWIMTGGEWPRDLETSDLDFLTA